MSSGSSPSLDHSPQNNNYSSSQHNNSNNGSRNGNVNNDRNVSSSHFHHSQHQQQHHFYSFLQKQQQQQLATTVTSSSSNSSTTNASSLNTPYQQSPYAHNPLLQQQHHEGSFLDLSPRGGLSQVSSFPKTLPPVPLSPWSDQQRRQQQLLQPSDMARSSRSLSVAPAPAHLMIPHCQDPSAAASAVFFNHTNHNIHHNQPNNLENAGSGSNSNHNNTSHNGSGSMAGAPPCGGGGNDDDDFDDFSADFAGFGHHPATPTQSPPDPFSDRLPPVSTIMHLKEEMSPGSQQQQQGQQATQQQAPPSATGIHGSAPGPPPQQRAPTALGSTSTAGSMLSDEDLLSAPDILSPPPSASTATSPLVGERALSAMSGGPWSPPPSTTRLKQSLQRRSGSTELDTNNGGGVPLTHHVGPSESMEDIRRSSPSFFPNILFPGPLTFPPPHLTKDDLNILEAMAASQPHHMMTASQSPLSQHPALATPSTSHLHQRGAPLFGMGSGPSGSLASSSPSLRRISDPLDHLRTTIKKEPPDTYGEPSSSSSVQQSVPSMGVSTASHSGTTPRKRAGPGRAASADAPSSRTYRCNACGKQLASKNVYQLHMRSHSGEKPFTCPLCQHHFSQKTSLTRHMRSHTGERPFPCEVCGKRFADKERIKIHMRTHTGEKPFACDVCGKQFSQKSTVKRHMSVHTGEKPFKCPTCQKGFANRGNLNAHVKTHAAGSGGNPPGSGSQGPSTSAGPSGVT